MSLFMCLSVIAHSDLSPTSPSLPLGFQPISVENVGPFASTRVHLLPHAAEKQRSMDRIAPINNFLVKKHH
jgi:hypothetical protein